MAADCKSADVSLRGCESLPAHILFTNIYLKRGIALAIEFNNEYISIVMEANLSAPEEIKSFVEDSDEACNIRMPVVVLDMKNVKEMYKFKIYAFVLMDNHVHLTIFDNYNNISQIMHKLCTIYAIYFKMKN